MTQLALVDEHAKMLKISNNLEFAGEAQSVITGFTLPIEMQVPRAQLIALMGEDFDRAVWTVDASGMITGVDWVRRLLPLALTGEIYVGVAAVLGLGGRELEYVDCQYSKIEILALGNGGITHLKGHLYLRPGIGSENLLLQEFQEHEIAASISAGKLRVKADKAQRELPLEPPASSPQAQASSDPAMQGESNAYDPAASADAQQNAIGTPEEERAKAHARERQIAQDLEHAHLNGDGPGDDDDDDDDDSMSSLGQRISEHAAKTA
jgi:hypothetical protein